MPHTSSKRGLFEADRRVELKMRLAVKRATEPLQAKAIPLHLDAPPEPEVVGRLIKKVRNL
jgi:hypothetical protein